MIKNIIFDIGNVIYNFNYEKVLNEYTSDKEKQDFIRKYIYNSPEWLGHSLIDTGYINKETAIAMAQDRTNHTDDELIKDFWNNYSKYGHIDNRILDLIKELKDKNYKIYLLSNTNAHVTEFIKKSGLFEMVDGYVLSYLEHQIKPYISIYKTLLNRYNLKEDECIFIDDNANNINTANSLGLIGKLVESDSYESVLVALNDVIKKEN